MRQHDVVLVHPPSIFDFRERKIFFGPISDVIPSSPLFEMYPVGFLTLAAYLRRHGYRVRIVNLALLMMRSRRFDPERFLARLKPRLFGIDLHWLPHVHGSLALGEMLKRLHPDIPIVYGGISSSYFHQELIREPAADFVLRGGVTEPCLAALLREIEGEQRYERVPNLTWKCNGEARFNPLSFVPQSLDEFDFNLGMMIRDVVKHLDFWSTAPFDAWWRHPITAVFTVRGCARGCVTCGASHSAFKHFMQIHRPLLRGAGAIAKQVRELSLMTRAPIFLVGDLTDGGTTYANDVIDALARTPVGNRIVFEFFAPPSRAFLERIDSSIRRWGAELSPESHDESIRQRLGKARFTNHEMQKVIDTMLALRCEQLDLFFMIGLPGQTYHSVLDTVDDIDRLFQTHDRRLSAFITPMGPFIDPGSDGFESAKAHGYRMRAHTLAEHRKLLAEGDSWESFLNYETEWMTRAEIVAVTYESAKRLNDLKERYGRISIQRAAAVRKRIGSEGIVNDKAELFEPGAFLRNFRLDGIIRLLLRPSSPRPLAKRAADTHR